MFIARKILVNEAEERIITGARQRYQQVAQYDNKIISTVDDDYELKSNIQWKRRLQDAGSPFHKAVNDSGISSINLQDDSPREVHTNSHFREYRCEYLCECLVI